MLNRFFLSLTLFATGAAVMVLEILGTKVISPFFGVGLYVWSSLITVTLLSLSLGYWVGGALADRQPKVSWLYGIVFLCGLATSFIPSFIQPVIELVDSWELRLGTLSASFLLFSIPLAGLGMISPFAIRLQAERLEGVGMTAGALYAVSTLGSFTGTLLAGFVLIPSLGVRQIFFLTAAVLMAMGVAGFLLAGKKRTGLALMVIGAAAAGTLVLSPHSAKAETGEAVVLHQSESFYGQIKVVDHEGIRSLLVNGAPQNFVKSGAEEALFEHTPYAAYLAALYIYRPRIKTMLMIGLGGGTLPSLFSRYGARVDVIEIDPRMEGIARKYFGYDPGAGRILIGDGRRVMRSLQERYDAFVLDAFSSYDQPAHLFTREMFLEVKGLLKEDGVIGINSAGSLKAGSARASKAILKTLQSVFAYTEAFHVEGGDRVGNIIFFASDKPLSLMPHAGNNLTDAEQSALIQVLDSNRAKQDLSGGALPVGQAAIGRLNLRHCATGAVLTDDYNPLPYWGIPVYRAWREEVIKFFGKKVLQKV